MVNLHFVQVTVVFASFCTKNFHTKDLLTRKSAFEKVGKERTSSCFNNSVAELVGVGVSSSSYQIFRTRTTSSSSTIIFSFRHWYFTTISFQIHIQV
ncbi:hypothetical protein H5410_064687 [Solanum commersonii]|uniref:Uncharacterized protein n=1 Tax=Solanum commersonii TaxID=4109 RepID=A0A9J5VYN1_SOLCO|nr:hypothetical protein H5410_064687 [Solanum commersonii]